MENLRLIGRPVWSSEYHYKEIRVRKRSWWERLTSRPWKPFQKYEFKRVPEEPVILADGSILAHPDTIKLISKW